MTVVSPIHTGPVNGHPVRYFAGPGDGPDPPWIAIEDLIQAMRLPHRARRHLIQSTRNLWKGAVRTVTTPDGIVAIAHHYAAQALIDALTDEFKLPERIFDDYCAEGVTATEVLMEGMSDEAQDAFWALAFRDSADDQGEP